MNTVFRAGAGELYLIEQPMPDRVQVLEKGSLDEQVKRVFLDDYQRTPDAEELRLAGQYGLVTLCRSLFNSNEFVIPELT